VAKNNNNKITMPREREGSGEEQEKGTAICVSSFLSCVDR